MNTGNYITSGILQDYCLGQLTSDEEREVEIMCHQYPALLKELHLLQQVLENYVGQNKITPPIELRNSVWKAVKKIWEQNSSE